MTFGELKENKCYTIKSEEFGTIKLNKKRQSNGKNKLSDLKWVAYRIDWTEAKNVPKPWQDFNEVIFSPYQITEDVRECAEHKVFFEHISEKEDDERPHIDGNTGNIHPKRQTYDNLNSVPIEQLVLCKGSGPKCKKPADSEEPFYTYGVPKAAYYPIINEQDSEIEEIKKSFGYQFLKKIWEEIHK